MTRRRLLEWINLYIDGEIDAEDLERLERLLDEDPEARRTYLEYCRLDQATRLVHRRFRMQAPPESFLMSDGSGYFGSTNRHRLRRMSMLAGGMAAAIALVSGTLIVFGPTTNPEAPLPVAATRTTTETSGPVSTVVASAPVINSFNADTALFDLEPASDGTLVPAAWKPRIEIPPSSSGSLEMPPAAWPAYVGILWNPSEQNEDGFPADDDQRVYRGPENRKGSPYQSVSFQFQK